MPLVVWLKLGLAGLLAATNLAVFAQPVNDNFASAETVSGLTGTTSGNNQGATMESGELSPISTDDNGTVDVTNSVWFQWTAPQNGNVTFDTIGSVDTAFNDMDTVLGAWTGTAVSTLTPVGADDNSGDGSATSKLTFFATAGTVYYITLDLNADTLGVPGSYVLNWTEQGAASSGTFQFTSPQYSFSDLENNAPLDKRGFMRAATARATVTRVGGADGLVDMPYTLSETIYTNWTSTNIFTTEVDTTYFDTNHVQLSFTNVISTLLNITNAYQNYNEGQKGFYYRFGPYSAQLITSNLNGNITFLFSNNLPFVTNPPNICGQPPSTSFATNNAVISMTTTQFFCTNYVITNYITSYSGLKVTNLLNYVTNGLLALPGGEVVFQDFEMNQDIFVPFAGSAAMPNLVNPLLVVGITNAALDPLEDPTLPAPQINGSRSTVYLAFNSSKGADLNTNIFGVQAVTNAILNFERATLRCNKMVQGSGVAVVNVTLTGPNPSGVTAFYRIDHTDVDDDNDTFKLQAGSDYARPDVANRFIAANDFTNQASTVTFPANDNRPQQIMIPITQDSEVKFDRDFQVELYWPDGTSHTAQIGNINNCDVTILFSTPAAGAVDTAFNPEDNALTSPPFNTIPGANGQVFASVVQPGDTNIVIGGDFTAYNNDSNSPRKHIARISPNGELDSTFDPGSGFDGDVEALALDSSGRIIAVGSFSSYQNSPSKGIVRINPDGSLDSTFNVGNGASSTVWAVAVQTNGQIIIGGDFTSYNNTNINYIARLNPDGSLDTTFNPGIGPNADIYSVALQPATGGIIIGGAFTSVDNQNSAYIAGLNADGTLNTTFNTGAGADTPINVVLVQTNGQVLIGGDFATIGGLPAGPGVARLNADGSIDSSFNVGTGPDNVVYTMALQPDGNILVGGLFRNFNQTRRVGVTRLLSNGWVDTSFMDTAYNQFAGVPNAYFDQNVNPPNSVNTVSVQPDGGVIIGGLFQQVGGDGEFPTGVRTVANQRNAIHPRSNLARLVGGTTPGPGNVGLTLSSYSADNNSPSFFVTLTRTNGALGVAAATFEAVPLGSGPGYAASGVDYTFNSTTPIWGSSWRNPTWMIADGLSGPNNNEVAINGNTFYRGFNNVALNIISNNNANTTLNVGVTQPQGMDSFFLGGITSASTAGFGNPAAVEGENIPLGVALGNSLAPLTIVHNPVSPTVFNFSQAYYYVAENAGTLVVTVTRSGGTSGQVRVNYSTSNGTALSGTDYTATGLKTLTFNDGVTNQTFSVTIANGNVARPDRVFNLALSGPSSGATLGTVSNAQVEIINDNITSGFATFVNGASLSANTVGYGTNETASSALISVARLAGSSGTLTVNFAATNGTAVNGVNYTSTTTNLTWINGDSSVKVISIPVMDDGVVTSNLTVNMHLSNALLNGAVTTNLLGLQTNAVLTITNTDAAGLVEFASASFIENENAGFAIIPVVRVGGSSGTVSVNYTTVNGSAIAGINYGGISGVLQFAAGQTSTNLIIGITNLNSPISPPLTFSLVLSNAVPTNSLGTPNVAQVNINGSQGFNRPPGQPDPSYGASGFNGPVSALALQSNGRLLVGGSFTQADGIQRRRIARLNSNGTLDSTFLSAQSSAGANDTVRSIVWQTNGLIVVGGAFTSFDGVGLNHLARINVNGTLDSEFSPGSGTDNPIFAMAQNYVNGQRKIVIGGSFTLYNGTQRNAIAQLTDGGLIDSTFNPGSGANATVFAVAAQADGKVVIGGDFTAVNGVALNHIARLNTDGSVDTTFHVGSGAGDSVRAIAIQLDGHIVIGGLFTNFNGTVLNRVARLNANGSVDPSFNIGTGANGNVATIALQSDTRILVGGSFSQFNGVTRNGVTRLNPDGTTDFGVNFGTGADGSVAATAIQGDGNIIFGGAFANFNGQPHADLVRVFGGSVTGSGAFQFSSANYQVDENGVSALITIIRTGGTSGPNSDGSGNITVPFSTANLTAVAGVNYTAVSTNISFPPGEVSKSVVVPVFDDGVITPPLTVSLNLGTPSAPGQVGLQTGAILTIINDDSGIEFSSPNYTVAKNAPSGVALINVNRIGSTNGTSTVVFNTSTNGTAVAGVDYTPITNALLTFGPGATNTVVPISIINNGLAEGNLTVAMNLTNATVSSLLYPSNAILTIVDTVLAPGTISFQSSNYTANASDGTAQITLVRTGGSSGSVSVTCTNIPETAVLNVNYQNSSETVTFNDGDTTKTFNISLINNPVPQPLVSLGLQLENVTGGASLGVTNAQLTIMNTNVGFTFVLATNDVPENAGTAELFVQRLGSTGGTLSVGYYTTNGTAIAGSNYVATSGTLTFFPGQSLIPIPVTLLNNTQQVVDLTFSVYLTNATAPASIVNPTHTVVVIQSVNAGISFTTNATTVMKNGGSITIPVVCSNPRVEPQVFSTNTIPLEVSYTTVDGTAVSGQDYQAVSGTLVFTNGIGTNFITVPIVNNGLLTGNRTFSLILTNPTPPGELTAPSTESVVIIDSNSGLQFSQSAYTVFKTGGTATIDVLRTGFTNSTVSVNYLVTNGTAVAGQNYLPTNGILIFTNGVTDQKITVPILAFNQIQPNLTVLLQLFNPTNGYLTAPSAATLTILENGGSVVIPAGAMLVTNYSSFSNYTNDLIGSNDQVQVLFAFRDSAGLGVTNLMATLLATNGVTSPNPGSQVYGPLVVYGHSVSKPFTFTANGTNGMAIAPTFNLYDNGNGGKFLGTATFGFTLGTMTSTFYNSNAITINDNAAATPYPATINVNGIGGSIVKSTVTLNGLFHTRPADIGIIVEPPSGTNTLLMANVGGGFSVTNATLMFDDGAATSLPRNSLITTSTNKPTSFPTVNQFP